MSTAPDLVVIDASMALAWLFERQHPSDSECANRLLAACGEVPWWIPGLWHLEMSNALLEALAKSHGFSTYDATYLELAQRLGAALASFDRQLNRAAGAMGVALFADP